MSTELVPTNHAVALPGVMPDVTSEALDRLGRWVDAASHAHKLVAPLIGTPWVPVAYQPKIDPRASDEDKARAYEIAVASATAAVLYGSSLGIDPLMALQQVYVIGGRPSLYAKMMVALVQSRGHEVWTEDQTDTRAVVCGRRKGSSHIERITVTMDMARKAGWTRNEAYGKTPQDMLWARAAGRVCDRVASDVLKGIPTVEEIQDETARENGAGTRTVRPPVRRAPEPAALEPPLEDEPKPIHDYVEASPHGRLNGVPEPAEEPGITKAQLPKLHAALREHNLADRTAALAYISSIVGRDVGSTKDLLKREAIQVIDALEALDGTAEPPLEAELVDEQPVDDDPWPPVATPPDAP